MVRTILILFLGYCLASAQSRNGGFLQHRRTASRPPPSSSGQNITDDFNRADNTDLGANWTVITAEQPLRIVSNTVQWQSGLSANDAAERYSGVTWTDNQSSEAEVTSSATEGPGTGFGVIVRASNSARTYYRLVINGDGEWEMGKNIAGTFTSLATGTATYSAGAILKLTAIGTTITSTYNGSQIDSRTDSSITTGWPGIAYSSTLVSGSLDDWRGIDGL